MIINNNKTDYLVSAAKGMLGAAPYVGPIITELIGNIIPNQRIDRISKFIQLLDERIKNIEKPTIEQRLSDTDFVDLFEDSFFAAAKSLTDERRSYIASLLTNSLSSKDIAVSKAKILLHLLNELSDPEIILLQFYAIALTEDRDLFYEKHKSVIEGTDAYLGSSKEELDNAALEAIRRAHLERLDLIQPHFAATRRGELPEFDTKTGKIKTSFYQITWLGRLLLRFIDLDDGMKQE